MVKVIQNIDCNPMDMDRGLTGCLGTLLRSNQEPTLVEDKV